MEKTNQEKRAEIAVKILRKLNYLPAYIREFSTHQKIFWSAEPYGFCYELDEETQKKVDAFCADRDNATVYAVIVGTYMFGSDKMEATTLLVVEDSDIETYEANVEAGIDPLTGILDELDASEIRTRRGFSSPVYRAYSYTYGWSEESGYVGVAGLVGGLTRVC